MLSCDEFEWVNRIDDEDDTDPKFEVIDKSTVRRKQDENDDRKFHIIQANHPITSLRHPYFEMKGFYSPNDILLVGLASKGLKMKNDYYSRRYGYDLDYLDNLDGSFICYDCYHEDHTIWSTELMNTAEFVKESTEIMFKTGDVVGFGITPDGFIFMTKNGKSIEMQTRIEAKDSIYPFICAGQTDSEIVANFGRDFFLLDSEKILDLYPKPTCFADHWKMQTKYHDFEEYHDLEIVSRDDVKIPCHRLVLGLRSQVLKNMIDSQEEGYIKLDGYNGSIIKLMIDFMYYDKIDEYGETAINVELLKMAKEYEIEDFLNLFEKALIKHLNLENVIPYWSIGRKPLRKSCAEFVSNNFNKFKESEQFMDMSKSDQMEATMLMMDVVSVKEDFVTKLELHD